MMNGTFVLQVSNGAGSVVSEEALVEVEALDILSIIEHFVEDRQITFRSLFMQFNRSTVRAAPHGSLLGSHKRCEACMAVFVYRPLHSQPAQLLREQTPNAI